MVISIGRKTLSFVLFLPSFLPRCLTTTKYLRQKYWHSVVNTLKNTKVPGGGGGGGVGVGAGNVLWISSDGDDAIGPKLKTEKNSSGFQQNLKISLDQRLTPPPKKKNHAEINNLQKA